MDNHFVSFKEYLPNIGKVRTVTGPFTWEEAWAEVEKVGVGAEVVSDGMAFHSQYEPSRRNAKKSERKAAYELSMANGEFVACHYKLEETPEKSYIHPAWVTAIFGR